MASLQASRTTAEVPPHARGGTPQSHTPLCRRLLPQTACKACVVCAAVGALGGAPTLTLTAWRRHAWQVGAGLRGSRQASWHSFILATCQQVPACACLHPGDQSLTCLLTTDWASKEDVEHQHKHAQTHAQQAASSCAHMLARKDKHMLACTS